MVKYLKEIPFLADIPDSILHEWSMRMEERTFAPRVTVIREGAVDDEMFLLSKGKLSVHKTSPTGQLYKVATLQAGRVPFFGEGAVFDTDPRSATVVTDEACHCVRVKRADWEWFCQRYPQYALPICTVMARGIMARLRKVNADLLHLYLNRAA